MFINRLSNRAFAWLCATIICASITIVLIVRSWSELATTARYAGYGVAAAASIGVLYCLYRIWDDIHTRHLKRVQLRALHEHEVWKGKQTLIHQQQLAQDRNDLERERLKLEQMKLTLEHERLMAAQQWEAHNVTLNAGQTFVKVESDGTYLPYHAPAQITARKPDQIDTSDDLEVPTAPKFLDMCHLITAEKAPLCFDVRGPVYGTVLDLLSMAVSGKPGRGKTTALMYYVAFLLRCGAEVWIFDPHGTMGELAKLNGRVLANMPATAKVVYLDRQLDMINAVPSLMNELNMRDELYRPAHEIKHPLLVLADELPVIAEFDVDIIHEWKLEDKHERDSHPLTFARLFKKFVLEARKWNCYFIGSGQTFDAETLPKKITDNLNSRIVFFSSDQRARMSGLENDAIKTLLPAIRRAGSGVMVFDCSRFDEPIMGAIPYITVDDLMHYLGVVQELAGTNTARGFSPDIQQSRYAQTTVIEMPDLPENRRRTDSLGTASDMPLNTPENTVPTAGAAVPTTDPAVPALGPEDKMLTPEQAEEFLRRYRKKPQAIKEILRLMNNGEGLSNRYSKHANLLLEQHNLKKG